MLHRGFMSHGYARRMMDQRSRSDRNPPPKPGNNDDDVPDEEPGYEWAEYNLPVFPIPHRLAEEPTTDALDFLGLGIDLDPQTFGNS